MTDTHQISSEPRKQLPRVAKEKPYSVFNFGWCKWYTWGGFKNNIKNCFSVVKWAWQRATKGYCDIDIYALDLTYMSFIATSLTDFRNKTCTFPFNFDSLDAWIAYLDKILDKIEFVQTDNYDINEFSAAYDNVLTISVKERTEEENEVIKRWLAREREIKADKRQIIKEIFNLIGEYFNDLWW